ASPSRLSLRVRRSPATRQSSVRSHTPARPASPPSPAPLRTSSQLEPAEPPPAPELHPAPQPPPQISSPHRGIPHARCPTQQPLLSRRNPRRHTSTKTQSAPACFPTSHHLR